MVPGSLSAGLPATEEQHRQDICTVGRWMYECELIVATEGNVSVRLNPEHILTTPTGMNKGMLEPEDLVVTDLEGVQLFGARKYSSELRMHLVIYRMRPDVNAICHAHPPFATGFAAAGRELDVALLPQLIVGLRKIPLVPYATPGTWELSVAIEPFVPYYDALLLANHGAVTCGPDLATAFFSMEVIEHAAKTILAAEVTGIRMLMSRRDVLKRVLSRARYVAPGESAGTSEEQIKLKQRGSQSLRQSGR